MFLSCTLFLSFFYYKRSFCGRAFPLSLSLSLLREGQGKKKGFQIQEPGQSAFPSSLPCAVMRTAGWNRMAAALVFWERKNERPGDGEEEGGRERGRDKGSKASLCDAGTRSGASNIPPSKAERWNKNGQKSSIIRRNGELTKRAHVRTLRQLLERKGEIKS